MKPHAASRRTTGRTTLACALGLLCVVFSSLAPSSLGQIAVVKRPASTTVQTSSGAGKSVSTLHWKNRDTLPGHLASATDSHLVWESPLFAGPLSIDRRLLQRIRFPSRKRIPPTEPFRFIMRNSDIFYADLIDITDKEVVVQSRSHGKCRLQRSAMLSLHRTEARNAATKRLTDGNSRVYMLNGSFLNGKITGINEKRELVLSNTRQPGVRIHLDRIASVYFHTTGRKVQLDYHLQISCVDGTRLRGKIRSIENGAITMQMNWSDQPFRCALDRVYDMRFLSSKTPETKADDMILFTSGKLHGELATADSGALAWRAVGGTQPVPLAADVSARIHRSASAGVEPPEPPAAGDVVYLASGDVLPCRIIAIDDEKVYVKSEISDVSEIERDQIKAVGFSTEAPLRGAGPGVGRWTVPAKDEQAVELAGEQVVFHGRGAVSRGGIFPCDEIQFNVKWNASQPLVMTVSMGSPDTRQRVGAPLLLAYFVGSDMLVRGLQGRLQQAIVQRNRARESQAKVRIIFGEQDVQVFVDGARRLSQPLNTSQFAARSIVFTVQQAGRQQAAEKKDLLRLGDFRVTRTGGPFRALRVDEEIKELLLTVPRFQSKKPPSHLLVARNGDLLRGELVDVANQRVRFSSRLTDFVFPRERLLGIISLDPETPEDATPPQEQPSLLRAVLTSGAAVSLAAPRFTSDQLIGQSSLLGEYSIPLAAVRALEIGGWQAAEETSVESPWRLQSAKEPLYVAFGGDGSGPGSLDDLGMHSPLVGTTVAKDLQIWLLNGKNFRLDQHPDKVVILEFWASWCGPCVRSMPETIEAVKLFGGEDVVLLAVNQQEPADVVREFIKARDLDVTVGLDRDGRIARQFQIDAIPQLIIIGKDRKIQRVFVGADPQLGERIKSVLEELRADVDVGAS